MHTQFFLTTLHLLTHEKFLLGAKGTFGVQGASENVYRDGNLLVARKSACIIIGKQNVTKFKYMHGEHHGYK